MTRGKFSGFMVTQGIEANSDKIKAISKHTVSMMLVQEEGKTERLVLHKSSDERRRNMVQFS